MASEEYFMLGWVTANKRTAYLIAVALLCSNVSFATTVTLDWSTVSWSGNTGSFNPDPNNPGSDITVTLTPTSGSSVSASIVSNPLAAGQKDLAITVWGSSTASVAVKFDFHYSGGVNDISVPISGVQMPSGASATEITNLFGTAGSTKYAGSYTIPTDNSAVSIVGSGLGSSLYGIGSDLTSQSNATINMLSKVTALQFNFGTPEGGAFGQNTFYVGPLMYIAGNPLTAGDPANQGQGGLTALQIVGDPEPMTFLLLGSGLAAIGFAHFRRRKTSS
jgi:hypothetical protein